MRTIDRSSAFKRDYKREAKGQHRATLDDALKPVLVALATDQPLDARYCGFHAIRPPSPRLSGRAFHAHPATCSTAIRPGSRSA
ncbi:type II toxin-antitoxin system YafQ family toxin, partial [Pseudomonas aeruginosa]